MQAIAIVIHQEPPGAPSGAAPTNSNQSKIIQFRQPNQSQVNQTLLAEAVEAWFARTVTTVEAYADKHRDYTVDLAAALSMFCVYPARSSMMAGDFFITGEYVPEECVAVYRLMSLEYSLNQEISAANAYKPHLEHGVWELIGFEHKGFPREMWRCRVCGGVTPGDGYQDLDCVGCGEVLMPAEEEDNYLMKQPIIIGFDADEGRSGGVDMVALMGEVAADLEAGGLSVRLEPRHDGNQQFQVNDADQADQASSEEED